MKKYTQEEYIEKCIKKHGDKYDLSNVVYKGMEKDVFPSCYKHGTFTINAWLFVNKCGCSKCAYEDVWKRQTKKLEDFLDDYKKTSKTYDTSKVVYKNCKTPVIFICHEKDEYGNEHGEFECTPDSMLTKGICPKCKRQHRRLNQDEFFERCKKVHNSFYEYDETVPYTGLKKHIRPICPIHGPYYQIAGTHLKGAGCPICANIKKAAFHTDNKESFVEKARQVHGDNYEYIGEYKGNSIKMIMKCNRCGFEFSQTPNSHLQGCGCPHCKQSKMEEELETFLKEKNISFIPQCKHDTFEWLGLQSLDFYLTDYSIAIECQGKQHFEPIDFFGGKERFNDDVERDKRKRKLCEEHNIPLYYINYNENIIKRINDILNKIKNK